MHGYAKFGQVNFSTIIVTEMSKTADQDQTSTIDFVDLDHRTPGEVYLCQISSTVSCGACCGLYNVKNLSRETLTRKLEDRTSRFAQIPRTAEDIEDFAGRVFFRSDKWKQPIQDFHHCPFLGMIGSESRTVCCLLHPLSERNAGVDWRGLSYYCASACASYFCPTCHELTIGHKRLIRQVADNWYDYGLMITETDMLSTFLAQVESRLGRPVNDRDLEQHPQAAAGIRNFLAIKTTWPFRDPDLALSVNFFFNKKENKPPTIDFKNIGKEGSIWAPVLTALWSLLPSPQALFEAESFLERMADDIVMTLL